MTFLLSVGCVCVFVWVVGFVVGFFFPFFGWLVWLFFNCSIQPRELAPPSIYGTFLQSQELLEMAKVGLSNCQYNKLEVGEKNLDEWQSKAVNGKKTHRSNLICVILSTDDSAISARPLASYQSNGKKTKHFASRIKEMIHLWELNLIFYFL